MKSFIGKHTNCYCSLPLLHLFSLRREREREDACPYVHMHDVHVCMYVGEGGRREGVVGGGVGGSK